MKSMTLHDFARLILKQPECKEPQVNVHIMERNANAPAHLKPFAVKIELFVECDTEEEACAFGRGLIMIVHLPN